MPKATFNITKRDKGWYWQVITNTEETDHYGPFDSAIRALHDAMISAEWERFYLYEGK